MKRKVLIALIIVLALIAADFFALFLLRRPAAEAPPAEPEFTEEAAPTLLPAETPAPTPEKPPEPVPAELPPQHAAQELKLSSDLNAAAAKALFDGNYYTDHSFPAGTRFTLTAEEDIASLYIVFGTYPEPWTLESDGTEQRCGQNGFLHEYVSLSAPSKSVTVALPDGEGTMIRDVYAFSEGYLPDYVQTWQPLEGGADILLFSTHDDDELIFFGGLIPYYSVIRGLRVQVAYMTSNYLTDFSDYRFRPHEALNGLWVAGTHFYPAVNQVGDFECHSYQDAIWTYGEDQFLEFQVEQIRRFKPLVVITQAENGEYGHGAHILTALSVERAVKAAADPAQFPESAEKYGVWDTPKTYLHNYDDPEDEYTWLSYELRAPELGWRSPFQVAQEAYRQHVTQQRWTAFFIYGFGHPYDSHRFGLYRSLVGPDEAHDDLMEHVSRDMYPFE